jgi:hypothetical protein
MIPHAWYEEPWKTVKIWVLKDAGRRYDNGLYEVETDATVLFEDSQDEGYSDVAERDRTRFLEAALDEVWKSRQQQEQKRQEEERKREEERKEDNANQKLERKNRAKMKILELSGQMRCSMMLRDRINNLVVLCKKWRSMSLKEREAFRRDRAPMKQLKKVSKMNRLKEQECGIGSWFTKRNCYVAHRWDLKQAKCWMAMRMNQMDEEKREEEEKEAKLRRRVKRWFSMTAQEKEVYCKKKLLLAKQKNKAKVRRSMMKDGGITNMNWTVDWGMDSWRRKATERRLRRRVKKWFSMTAQERKVYSKKKLLLAKQKNKAKIRRSVRKDLKGSATEQDWNVYWERKAEEKRAAKKKALEEEMVPTPHWGISEGRQGQTDRHTDLCIKKWPNFEPIPIARASSQGQG